MKNIFHSVKHYIFLFIWLLLVFPLFQSSLNLFNIVPLKGDFILSNNTDFTIKGWFSGEYQTTKERYLNEAFGFRNIFVRINNQIAFSFFNKAKANSVVIGKQNYLYEENYIKAYYGTDFIGTDSIAHRLQRIKFIQDTLAKLNKNIILVFAAGKGSFYPEYFPEKYKSPKGKTNFEYHIKYSKELNLNYIDFNNYFIDNKYKSKYLLYPKYGIHWSYYGMCLVADSLIHYIEYIRHINMLHLYWNQIEMDDPKESDYDIADGMNIKFKLKSEKMAYPKIQFQSDSGKTKPSVLVISDSYYWGIYNFGISQVFSQSHFWFYNKQVYPEYYQNGLETSRINLKDEIAKHDVIIILATEATLPNFGWGFIENVYNLYKGNSYNFELDNAFREKVFNLRNYIKTDKNWLKQIEQKAKVKGISIDSMLTLDAIWAIRHADNKK